MSANGTRLKRSFSIKRYIFNQSNGNSIAATSQIPEPLAVSFGKATLTLNSGLNSLSLTYENSDT